MIIDADTHIAPTGGAFTLEQHLARMERAGIDKTLTWLKPDYVGEEIEGYNRYVYEATHRYPDRILGFGWADPTVSVKHAKKMVQICTEEYGFYGVKLKRMERMYRQEMAERKRLAEELRNAREKLKAKENEVEILNKALDELKLRLKSVEGGGVR